MSWKSAGAGKASGYQIKYTTDKKFKKNVKTKTITRIPDAKTIKKKLKKLKIKKTYYVKVRPFNYVTNKATGKTKRIYGKWSKVKKIKKR